MRAGGEHECEVKLRPCMLHSKEYNVHMNKDINMKIDMNINMVMNMEN